jgi:hypothetical protein
MLSLRSVGKKTNTAKRLLINKRQRLAPYSCIVAKVRYFLKKTIFLNSCQ